MALQIAQIVSWGPIDNPGSLQTHHFEVSFEGAPDIVATAYLAEVSIGYQGGPSGGVVVAAFKRFQFLDGNGVVQEQEITEVASFLHVASCVSITVALDVNDATGLGGWTFYSLS